MTSFPAIAGPVDPEDGDPAAGGAPFAYPVVAGGSWGGGAVAVIIKDEGEMFTGPKPAFSDYGFEQSAAPGPSQCVVPLLKGRSLKASRRLLMEAKCLVGDVFKRGEATAKAGKVVRQIPRPGTSLELWASVNLTLGPRPVGSR